MWKIIVEWDSPQMTIWRIHIAFRITKAINPHSQCVIITAFPLQQWLQEHASVLRYTYIACLLVFCVCYPILWLCLGRIVHECYWWHSIYFNRISAVHLY